MTCNELKLLHMHLNSASHFLEFGAGASTVYAAGVDSIKQIDSVESSAGFIKQNLNPQPAITTALTLGKLVFHVIDIGSTWLWGYPTGFCKRKQWPNYASNIFTRDSQHDLVLIDGRFRVACTLNCILNAPSDCKILIHDFWNRPAYHVVLPFLDTKVKVDTLGLFEKKLQVDRKRVNALLTKYQYLPL